MSRHREIEEWALQWLIRKEEPEWDESDDAELNAWLDESMAHKAAYWRAVHGWREADRIRSLGVLSGETTTSLSVLRKWWPALMAASVIGFVGSSTYLSAPDMQAQRPVQKVLFSTPVGGRRIIPLADGSSVQLNTATVVRTAVNERTREVWLDTGEAYFEIAQKEGRPFVVHAGRQTVTVLGTKFAVRRDEDRVTVNVIEGRVRVDDSLNMGGSAAIITAGDFAIARGPSTLIATKSEERVESALAWREGMLSFDQTPLAEVAVEFNRYHRKPLIVTDRTAAAIRIGGTFEASNVEAFARLLRDAYGLKVENGATAVKISS